MITFRVTPPEKDLALWLQKHLLLFDEYVKREAMIKLFTAAPLNPEEGQIVRADGTSWNPGSGAGFYGYHGGTWKFLG